MADVLCKCDVCEIEFKRKSSEVNRNQKKGRGTFCSLNCAGSANLKNLGDKRVWDHLRGTSKRDVYSPFRFFYKLIAQRNQVTDLSLQDLKEQWDKQNGICPYTGWQMKIMQTLCDKIDRTPNRASLDRIDSTKGYTHGNIQYVSLIAQYAKNSWNEDVLFEFANAVIQHKNK